MQALLAERATPFADLRIASPSARADFSASSSLLCDRAATLAMGSNPQIHYTPQQQMGYGGYSVPCRVGNWAEDEYLGAVMTSTHQKKQEAGMLTSQQLGGTLGAALAPAMLAPAPSDSAIRFGDVVMLSAAMGGVLALDSTNRVELPQEAYAVTRTRESGAVACTRTAWTVTPPTGTAAPEDGLLRIGMRFCLTSESGNGGSAYLQSMRYTLHNQNYSASKGLRKQGCAAVPEPSADTLWEVRVLDPSDLAQMESEGHPVPSNTFVSLVHINTQIALCTGEHVVKNKYGGEFEVTAHTESGLAKCAWGTRAGQMLGVGNHWAFTTAEDPAPAPAAEPAAEGSS
jgi:hypothetical protein